MEQMEKELVRLKRIPGSRAAVLMCDLDFFKAINDTHGHAVGDRVLQHFGSLLRKDLRNIDIAGRVGGEEFAVVLPGADVAAASAFARRLQQLLAEQPFRSADGDIALTVSIGVAALRAADSSAGVAMSRSDNALYIAKRNGRNRIELAPG
jgi:diguanylate cyclase (GGDEF)-like protein